MDKSFICTADTLIKEANKILTDHGLCKEKEILCLVKSASVIVWNNADPDIDESFVHWITDIELSFVERIAELHWERIAVYLSD